MAVIITYVCDCCGGISNDIAKFQPTPIQLTLNSWLVRIDNALLCLPCVGSLVLATETEMKELQGTKTGQEL